MCVASCECAAELIDCGRQALEVLLSVNASVDAPDVQGNTALHTAAFMGNGMKPFSFLIFACSISSCPFRGAPCFASDALCLLLDVSQLQGMRALHTTSGGLLLCASCLSQGALCLLLGAMCLLLCALCSLLGA